MAKAPRWRKKRPEPLPPNATLMLAYFFLNTVLGLFPWTRPFARVLFKLVLDPLASLWFGFLDALPSLAFLLVLMTNALTVKLALAGAVLASGYPFFKRFTHVPQVVLGIAFGWGIPMAFAAQSGFVPATAWWLLAINTVWSVIYDTQYAMVDRADDLAVGIKSTAILFGRYDVPVIAALMAVMLTLLAAGVIFAITLRREMFPESRPDKQPAAQPETTPGSGSGPAEPAPAKQQAPAAAESETGMWAVQLGSFSNAANAERLAADLRQQGFAAFLSKLGTGDGELHRVRVGPQANRQAAEAVAIQLSAAGHSGKVVPHP